MLKKPAASLALAIIMLLGHRALAQEPEGGWSPQQREIIALIEQGPVGIEQDFERWESTFSGDWTVWFAGSPAHRQKTPHMELVRDYVGQGNAVTDFELELVTIVVNGDSAFAQYNATETISQANGSPRFVRYAAADFYVREDGAWKQRASTVAHLPPAESDD